MQTSFANLHTDYLDLVLLHYPRQVLADPFPCPTLDPFPCPMLRSAVCADAKGSLVDHGER